jgi:probable HAF family extracellular repeat protein
MCPTLGLLAATLVLAPARAGAQVFESIDGSADGFSSTRALAVSADGLVVVGIAFAPAGDPAFRWSDGVLTVLGDLPGANLLGIASAVSADGAIVVGTGQIDDPLMQFESRQEAFRSVGGGLVGIGDLAGGSYDSQGNAVSADGAVIVGTSLSASGTEAFRWTEAGGMVGLGDLDGGDFRSFANGVSADGTVIAGTGTTGVLNVGIEPYRWTQATGMVGLGVTGIGTDVSADGTTVVGQDTTASNNRQAFRWTEALGVQHLGDFPGGGVASVAHAVSADGSVVVGQGTDQGTTGVGLVAFIWTQAQGLRRIEAVLTTEHGVDLSDWELTDATGISADGGVVVGQGYLDGVEQGWIARLPEPAGALAALVSLASLALARQRL